MASSSLTLGRAFTLTIALIAIVIGVSLARLFTAPLDSTSPDPSGSSSDRPDLRTWSAPEVQNRLLANESIVFLDTRLRSEFEEEHILDSVWFPRDSTQSFTPESGTVYILIVSSEDDHASFWQPLLSYFAEQKMQYAVLEGGLESWRSIGGSVVSRGDPTSYLDQSKVTYVTPQNAALLIPENSTTFLDIRGTADFSRGHIPGALNIPLSELERRRRELPVGRAVVVYGNDELTAFQGAVRLFDMNFFGPRVLEGGLPRWQELNFPLETN